MTAYERALQILRQRGPLEPVPFGKEMWPVRYNTEDPTAFSTSVGNFLAGMVRRGMVRKVGRRYRARRTNQSGG